MAAGSGLLAKSGWPCADAGPPWAASGLEGPPLGSSSRRIEVDHLLTDIFRKLITGEDYIKKPHRRQSSRGWVVVPFEFSVYSNYFTERHLEGRKRARVLRAPFTPAFGENGQISGRVALRDLVFTLLRRKVLPPYSGAEDGAPSLTGAQDDGLFIKIGH